MSRMRVLSFLLFVFASLGAQSQEPLRIVGRVPLPGDSIERQIVLFFNQPIRLDGFSVNEPDAWFSVEPAVNGVKKVGETYIAFEPENPYAEPVLRIRFAEGLTGADGGVLAEDQRSVYVSPQPFMPGGVWNVAERNGQSILGINFPFAVAPAALQEKLSVVSVTGQTIAAVVSEGTDPTVLQIALPAGTNLPVTIRVAAGLAESQNRFTTGRDWSMPYPEDSVLRVSNAYWGEYDESAQIVAIDFNREVRAEALAEALSLEDAEAGGAIPFTVETGGSSTYHEVQIRLANPSEATVRVRIAAGLEGGEGTQLTSSYEQTLTQRPIALVFNNHYMSNDERQGYQVNFSLSAPVKLDALREHFIVTPELENMRLETQGDRQFTLAGEWRSRTTYTIEITAGLKYHMGAVLEESLSREVLTGDVPASLAFGHEGKMYFPRRSGGQMPLVTRNVGRANVALHRLFPGNIVVALDNLGSGGNQYDLVYRWSEKVSDTEIPIALRPDAEIRTYLDLNAIFPEGMRGVFTMAVSARYAGSKEKVVILTDIGAIAHWTNTDLRIFTHDLLTLAPLADAKVTLYSYKNQPLGEASTDAQGIASFAGFTEELGQPKVAVIEKGDDFTFLELDPIDDSANPIDYSLPNYDAEAYDGYVYADRDLYRPGETVHLKWSVRTGYGDAAGNVPLVLKIFKPNGRELSSEVISLNEFGTAGKDFVTERVFPTGTYRAELRVPDGDRSVGDYTFKLEDFVPNRMKAEIAMEAQRLETGAEYAFTVNAQHLFGAPAAGRRVEAAVYFKRAAYSSPAWPGFTFNNESDFTPDPLELGEVETDAEGDAQFTFAYDAPKQVTFPMEATVVGRAYELGGRAVSARLVRPMLPGDLLLGAAARAGSAPGQVVVEAAAIQGDESAADLAAVKVTLEREEWRYNVRRYYDSYQPYWIKSFEAIETREVSLAAGRGQTTFDAPQGYGYYQVRVHSDATPVHSTVKFYRYWDNVDVVDSARPSLITLTADKASYDVGETANVRIESPFDGQAVVTILGPQLRQLPPVPVTGGVASVAIPLTAELVPNAWVEVTVLHNVETNAATVHPYVSTGTVNLLCVPQERKIDVAVQGLPEAIRPGEPLELTIQTRRGGGAPVRAEVTVAAVDEGIHGITEYESPDPFAFFTRPRRPNVSAAHYYDYVAYDFSKPRIGGDGYGDGLANRLPFVGDNWIKPVALWSGDVVTDDQGAAVVRFDIPEFNGQLRIVAVANAVDAFGAQDGQVFVRRPYMLQTSMPRFLLPGDAAECRATLFNTTDAPIVATVSYAVEGALAGGTGSREITLDANSETTIAAPITAGLAPGQGTLTWTAAVTDPQGAALETVVEAAPIPVREPAAYTEDHAVVTVAPGESVTLANTAMTEDERTRWDVTVSGSPVLRIQRTLEELADYPYGCAEQTVSRLFPLYLMRREEALIGRVIEDGASYTSMIEDGVRRVFAMQTDSGGIAYWPGSDYDNAYASVYAFSFLALVNRDKEIQIPRQAFQALREYVRNVANDWNGYYGHSLYTRAFAAYALAMDRDLGALVLIDRFATLELPRSSRYLLAAALAVNTNDADRIAMFMSGPVTTANERSMGGDFSSPLRDAAVELMALDAMNAPAAEQAAKANELVAFLESGVRANTQELAFIAAALGPYLQDLAADPGQIAGSIAGPNGEAPLAGTAVYTDAFAGAGASYTVTNSGQLPIYINRTIGGVPLQPDTAAVAAGIELERAYFYDDGAEADGAALQQGETYVVRLHIDAEQDLEYVILSELLPAGLEIENPRLDPTATPGGPFGEGIEPSHTEIRDDRLVIAVDSLPSGGADLYYIVRAVTPGVYTRPRAVVEAMYAPDIRGATAQSEVIVEAQ